MKVYVKPDDCISCGVCVDLCPDVFEWDEDDKARAITPKVSEENEDCAQEAIDECPTDAIEEID